MLKLRTTSLLMLAPLLSADKIFLSKGSDCSGGAESCKQDAWKDQRAAERTKGVSSSEAQHADVVALLFSLLGGFFMGAYPVPIKAPSVLKVSPHPVIFQCYKTFWVFVTGWLFLLPRWWRQESPVYCPTWWGLVSALAWIPSGVCAIAAVPLVGVGMTSAVATGCGSTISFLVFWLVLGESMKEHSFGGHVIYFAPVYLACIMLGLAGMVSAAGIRSANTREQGQRYKGMAGLVLAMFVGTFSAIQFGAVNLGKQTAQRSAGCAGDLSKCSPEFVEAFNNFGSWMASFGVGALVVTAIVLATVVIHAAIWQKPRPPLHWKALAGPGSTAGLLWALGNFFQTAAVVRGGSAVMLPANQAIQLVTSGAFGLLYYHEIPNVRRALFWSAAAIWTLGSVILLSQEKA